MPRILYRINTERLILRCFELADTAALYSALIESREHLLPFVNIPEHEISLEAALATIRRWRTRFDSDVDYFFAGIDRQTLELVGCVALIPDATRESWELTGWLREDRTHMALAIEGVSALQKLVFGVLGGRRAEMRCAPTNQRTPRLAARLGFAYEKTIPNGGRIRDQSFDQLVFALDKEGWGARSDQALPFAAFDALGRPIVNVEPLSEPMVIPADASNLWQSLLTHLEPRVRIVERRDAVVTVGAEHRFADGVMVYQETKIALAEAFGRPWAVLCSPVGAHLSLKEALEHNKTLALGALTLDEEDMFVLRHPVALHSVDLAGMLQMIHEVGREAARLRGLRRQPQSAAPVLSGLYSVD